MFTIMLLVEVSKVHFKVLNVFCRNSVENESGFEAMSLLKSCCL